MDKIFNEDSPLIKVMSRCADLLLLNILTLLGCLGVFSIGASLTAMHYVLLKLVRGEEGYISKNFFKSFKENFKQATIIWLILFAIIAVVVGDIFIVFYTNVEFPAVFGVDFPTVMGVVLVVVGVLFSMVWLYVFPVLSHFDNTVKNTIKNSFMMAIAAFPRTVAMILVHVIIFLVLYYVSYLIPLVLLLGFSGTGYLCALFYSGTFKKFEPEEEQAEEIEEIEGEVPEEA